MRDPLEAMSQATPQPAPETGEILKVVGFTLGGQEYVVDILKVKEIKLMMPITRVPKAPVYLQGVANLRGDIIPVIDLRKKLKLPPEKATEETRIMVIELESRLLGIIVDSVTENYDLRARDISPPPAAISSIEAAFVRGVAKIGERLLIFLDIDRLMAVPGSATPAPFVPETAA
jgi:purine-binding chemotaxis protein CheW